jgi:hypothetical protein
MSDNRYEGFVEFADATLISLQCFDGRCRECPDPHKTGGEGPDIGYPPALNGYYCTHGCDGENQPAGSDIDRLALNAIQKILRDPEWAVGMLEDIGEIVRKTGRKVENYPDERET